MRSRLQGRVTAGLGAGSRRLAALVGASLLACLATQATGQPRPRIAGPTAPPPDDGLGPRDLYLQADTLIDDREHHTVTAVGHVEARMHGRTLRADRLIYDTVTGASHAIGHAVVVNADGTSEYGQDVLLDDQFRAAVAYGFAARLQDNSTIVAGEALRRNETVDQLNSAVYTPCDICAQDGSPKSPTWSIQATRITQDRQHHVIYYRNALVRIHGVPIFYAPVFWHPDPTSPRRAGLLTPLLDFSRRRGFSYEQPYLFTLGPSTDLIVSPQFNSRINPLLDLEYTERFYSGLIDVRAGYTYSEEFDNHTFFNKDTSRSYILGRGLFDIDPHWNWGFGVERVTDPTFFARYGVHDVYTDRGPFPTDTDRLVSQVFTQRQDQDTFVSIAAISYESLRAYGRQPVTDVGHANEVIGETNQAFPTVGPLIEARYDPTEPLFGGQLHIKANFVDLSRNHAIINVDDPTSLTVAGPQQFPPQFQTAAGYLAALAAQPNAQLKNPAPNQALTALTYTDARRASAEVDWNSSFTLDNGIRIEPFLIGRGDLFSVSDSTLYRFGAGLPGAGGSAATAGLTNVASQPGESTITRGLPTVGATVSWPFIRPVGAASLVLEPIAQLVVAPSLSRNANIPDEDSVAFEYDDTNLFSVNRFAGYDLLESGQRLNVGGRATIDWGAGRSASAVLGRTFRAEPDYNFNATSGLQGTASDYVAAVTFVPSATVSFFTRARLDANTLSVRQNETGLNLGTQRISGGIRYDYNENGFQPVTDVNGVLSNATLVQHSRTASVTGQAFITQHWGATANVTRDYADKTHYPIEQVGVFYLDQCIRLDILYTHDETYNGVIGTSDSINFRLTLATLGNSGSIGQPRAGGR